MAVVDIPPPTCDLAPVIEPAEPHTDAPSPTEEPVEIDESHTASPTKPEVQPAVLETLLDSTPGPDQESFIGLANSPEVETDPMLCPKDVFNRPQPIPADSDGPDVEPEVEPADECVDPCLELPETSTGGRSLVPLPRRGTRSRKQPERYTLIRRLQIPAATQVQTGSSVWLLQIIGIAVTLSRSFPSPQSL